MRFTVAKNTDLFFPFAVIISIVFHMAMIGITLRNPFFHRSYGWPSTIKVNLLSLPSGMGGNIRSESLTEKVNAPLVEENGNKAADSKLALPGKDEKKLLGEKGKPADVSGLGKEGNSGLGGSGHNIIFDETEFPYAWYKARLEALLKANWDRPVSHSKQTISTTVHFFILDTGRVERVEIVQSSGDTIFDQSVLRTVFGAQPYPKFPSTFSGTSLGVLYTFELLPEEKS